MLLAVMVLLLSYKHFHLAQCCLTPTANPAACCCPTAAAIVFAIHHSVNFFPACGTQGNRVLCICRVKCCEDWLSCEALDFMHPVVPLYPQVQIESSGLPQEGNKVLVATTLNVWNDNQLPWTSIQYAFSYQMIQVKDVWSFSYSQSLLSSVPFEKNIYISVHACKI